MEAEVVGSLSVEAEEETVAIIRLCVEGIAVRPERQFPSLMAGFGKGGRKGGSIYAKLVPLEPWEISIEVPAAEAASLDGLAVVVKQLFNQMDTVLITLADGLWTASNNGSTGQELRAR